MIRCERTCENGDRRALGMTLNISCICVVFPVGTNESCLTSESVGTSQGKCCSLSCNDFEEVFFLSLSSQLFHMDRLQKKVPHAVPRMCNMKKSCKNAHRTHKLNGIEQIIYNRKSNNILMGVQNILPYLYVSHSVIIEIGTCCEALATNGTFCSNKKRWSWELLSQMVIFWIASGAVWTRQMEKGTFNADSKRKFWSTFHYVLCTEVLFRTYDNLPWGFSPEWMRRWVFNELDVLKPFPQTPQTWGFSPVNDVDRLISIYHGNLHHLSYWTSSILKSHQ